MYKPLDCLNPKDNNTCMFFWKVPVTAQECEIKEIVPQERRCIATNVDNLLSAIASEGNTTSEYVGYVTIALKDGDVVSTEECRFLNETITFKFSPEEDLHLLTVVNLNGNGYNRSFDRTDIYEVVSTYAITLYPYLIMGPLATLVMQGKIGATNSVQIFVTNEETFYQLYNYHRRHDRRCTINSMRYPGTFSFLTPMVEFIHYQEAAFPELSGKLAGVQLPKEEQAVITLYGMHTDAIRAMMDKLGIPESLDSLLVSEVAIPEEVTITRDTPPINEVGPVTEGWNYYGEGIPAMEADNSTKSNKRQRIEAVIIKTVSKLDPSLDNAKYYQGLFAKMDDKEFTNFMEMVRSKKFQLHITMPNMIKNIRIRDILDAAHFIGYKTAQRIWMPDPVSGRKFLTTEPYLILRLPVRRAQQEIDKGLSVPDGDTKINMLTGQVTGPDKACSISTVEIRGLYTRGLDNTMQELVQVRGGDIANYGDFRRQLEENGEATLAHLDPNSRTRASVIAKVLLKGALFDINI